MKISAISVAFPNTQTYNPYDFFKYYLYKKWKIKAFNYNFQLDLMLIMNFFSYTSARTFSSSLIKEI